MKQTFKMKGTCGACGAEMEFKGFRDKKELPPVLFDAFRAEFRAARSMRGVSLRQVEKETGLSNALLSQLESGKIKDTSLSTYETLRKWMVRP